jgi:copper homeostasis protein
VLLEVIAETLEDAREAEQGGAGRIELVRDLDRGGLTPPLALIEAVVKAVRIPVRVMLRDREPFEIADRSEARRLRATARDAHERGVQGFVAGFLRGGAIDLGTLQRVMDVLANPVTFHRAFDAAADPLEALAVLAPEARVDRVLTSGGTGDWPARLARLGALRLAAPARVIILPGGGIDDEALRALAAAGFPEAHVGRAARVPAGHSGRVRASRVAQLVALATGGSRTARP